MLPAVCARLAISGLIRHQPPIYRSYLYNFYFYHLTSLSLTSRSKTWWQLLHVQRWIYLSKNFFFLFSFFFRPFIQLTALLLYASGTPFFFWFYFRRGFSCGSRKWKKKLPVATIVCARADDIETLVYVVCGSKSLPTRCVKGCVGSFLLFFFLLITSVDESNCWHGQNQK